MMSGMQTEVARRRFTVAEYETMVRAGIFGEDEHVELIDGDVVMVPPQGPEHSGCTTILDDRLSDAYGDGFVVREAKPLVTDDGVPEPDHAVVRGASREFVKRHPRADEAVLVVEVAWTSQALDRAKAAVYARAGAPVYWLLDLAARRLEVHTEPQRDGRYRVARVLAETDEVALPEIDVRWRVADLLP
jgi:Uma2 family endonuclease